MDTQLVYMYTPSATSLIQDTFKRVCRYCLVVLTHLVQCYAVVHDFVSKYVLDTTMQFPRKATRACMRARRASVHFKPTDTAQSLDVSINVLK